MSNSMLTKKDKGFIIKNLKRINENGEKNSFRGRGKRA